MHVSAGAALSRERRTGDAVAEASRQALRSAGIERASLCVCFTTSEHLETAELGATLRRATGARWLLGCSGRGVFATDGVCGDGPGLAVLVLEGVQASISTGRRLDEDPAAAFDAVAPALAPAAGGATLVLADPAGGFQGRMVAGLDAAGVPVLGGGASGRAETAVLAGDERLERGLAVARLSGVRATAEIAASARPVGPARTITGADRSEIASLDGRPALEVLRETLALAGVEPARAGQFLLAGLAADHRGERLDRGHLLLRPIVAVDRRSGSITVGERVRRGQAFTFCLREAVGARDELRAMLDRHTEARAGARPVCGIYVDCVGRGDALYGEDAFDLEQILRRHPGLPLVGFQSAFELGPLGGRTRLHVHSGALLLLG